MNILGISAFYHDSAAALVSDGHIIAAAQEERFSRVKNDHSFPRHAISYCLSDAGLDVRDLDVVGFYEWPQLRFERILTTFLDHAPRGRGTFARVMPVWTRQKAWIEDLVAQDLGFDGPILRIEHHRSHAASAFFPSPFEESAIITFDAVGEWTTTSWGLGRGRSIDLQGDLRFPHSLGMLYSAFTQYLGFEVNEGEYKVMGLAPYGEPRYVDVILGNLLELREDGSFQLNMRYFDYEVGSAMTNQAFAELLGGAPRRPDRELTQRHMDLARSIQEVTNEVVLRIARYVRRETGLSDLCMAGGVALNCVANGLILRHGVFDRLWIQPAAGDAGGSLGVALDIWFEHLGNERRADGAHDVMRGAFLGPSYDAPTIQRVLDAHGATYHQPDPTDIPMITARAIADGRVVGWFQGRTEFGPRALGARSILADARRPEMQSVLNQKIKFRESFRPFAPSVLEERASAYFELSSPSPYMLLITDVSASHRVPLGEEELSRRGLERLAVVRSDIPAVTHVDASARIQTVSEITNPVYYRVLREFEKLTGCPVIVNTSLNVKEEPICSSPEDAYRCFLRTGMDSLVIGPFVLHKEDQSRSTVASGEMPSAERTSSGGFRELIAAALLSALYWVLFTALRAVPAARRSQRRVGPASYWLEYERPSWDGAVRFGREDLIAALRKRRGRKLALAARAVLALGPLLQVDRPPAALHAGRRHRLMPHMYDQF